MISMRILSSTDAAKEQAQAELYIETQVKNCVAKKLRRKET